MCECKQWEALKSQVTCSRIHVDVGEGDRVLVRQSDVKRKQLCQQRQQGSDLNGDEF